MFIVFIRTMILYILIIFAMRIMGKRQIGELQPSELVVTILISNIATLPIEDTNIPLFSGIIPIMVLVCLEVIISCITLKSLKARKIISGSPRVIIQDGKVIEKELKKLRFSVDDLIEELRIKSIFDISTVACAIVETTGKISVYQKIEHQNPSLQDLNIEKQDCGPHFLIVSDGRIVSQSLQPINKDIKWVYKILKKEKTDIKDILMLTCNQSGDYNLVLKQNKK